MEDRRIYKTFVRPYLEYGLVAMTMENDQWDKPEKAQVQLLAEVMTVKPHNKNMLRAVTRITTVQQRREERLLTIR